MFAVLIFPPAAEDEDENENENENVNEDRKRLWCGDSWFGSVKCAANIAKMGQHCIMQIKTGHARYPKNFFEEAMKDFPGGTWIIMEGHAEKENQDLVAIGYKYNTKTVLQFVCTKGAGATKAGEPYQARFPEKFGNVCARHVLRPHVISMYFKHSNVVDVHNQARQFELALEKMGYSRGLFQIVHNSYWNACGKFVENSEDD